MIPSKASVRRTTGSVQHFIARGEPKIISQTNIPNDKLFIASISSIWHSNHQMTSKCWRAKVLPANTGVVSACISGADARHLINILFAKAKGRQKILILRSVSCYGLWYMIPTEMSKPGVEIKVPSLCLLYSLLSPLVKYCSVRVRAFLTWCLFCKFHSFPDRPRSFVTMKCITPAN